MFTSLDQITPEFEINHSHNRGTITIWIFFKEIEDIIKDYKKHQEKDGLVIKTCIDHKTLNFS